MLLLSHEFMLDEAAEHPIADLNSPRRHWRERSQQSRESLCPILRHALTAATVRIQSLLASVLPKFFCRRIFPDVADDCRAQIPGDLECHPHCQIYDDSFVSPCDSGQAASDIRRLFKVMMTAATVVAPEKSGGLPATGAETRLHPWPPIMAFTGHMKAEG
jgi:hypothetical protein